MKLKIANGEDLQSAIDAYGCLPAAKIQSIINTIFEITKSADDPRCEIRIHTSLVPSSYVQAPGMFGRSIARQSVYKSVKSLLKGKYLQVVGSNDEIPSTFRARVEQALKGESMRIKVERSEVPRTYRSRPALLAHSLSIALDEDVVFIKKPEHIIWKIKRKE